MTAEWVPLLSGYSGAKVLFLCAKVRKVAAQACSPAKGGGQKGPDLVIISGVRLWDEVTRRLFDQKGRKNSTGAPRFNSACALNHEDTRRLFCGDSILKGGSTTLFFSVF